MEFGKRSSYFILLFLFCMPAEATKQLKHCSDRHLELKDCRLQKNKYQLSFHNEKWMVFNGIHRRILPMPLVGEDIEWQKVKVSSIKQNLWVEMWLWDKPRGDVKLQSLYWYAYLLKVVEPQLVTKQEVQERLPIFSKKSYRFSSLKKPKIFKKGSQFYWSIDNKEFPVTDVELQEN